MNVLLKLLETIPNGKVKVKTVLQKEIYYFKWNQPTKKEQIESFEMRTGYTLPDEYKEFLLQSNGGIIFKTEFEDDGYKLLGIDEIEKMTHEMIKLGYEIPNGYFCFIQCLYSDDVLFLDLNRLNSIVVDGDIAYPYTNWKHISGNINDFFAQLIQCNGSTFWRWYIL